MEQKTFLSSLAAVNLEDSTSEDEYEQAPPEEEEEAWSAVNRTQAAGVQLSSGATAKIASLCGDILRDAMEDDPVSGSEGSSDCSSDRDYDIPVTEQVNEHEALERTRERQWRMHEDTGLSGVWFDGTAKREYTVVLNVYKLPYYHVFGAYHTGVEIEGVEHAFRAGDHEGSGVFECKPCHARGYDYKESVMMGTVDVSPQQLDAVLKDLRLRFRARDYSLTHRNCNHYSDALCNQLLGRSIPSGLNRLASLGASLSSAGPSLQQREKEHTQWCKRQEQEEQDEREELEKQIGNGKPPRSRSRLSLSAIYMRGIVERRFESYAELDGSRKVIELRRLPDFELLKVTRLVPQPTRCSSQWSE